MRLWANQIWLKEISNTTVLVVKPYRTDRMIENTYAMDAGDNRLENGLPPSSVRTNKAVIFLIVFFIQSKEIYNAMDVRSFTSLKLI